jgi:cold-inducible RNA-binding protein
MGRFVTEVFDRVGVRLFVGNLDYSVGEAELRAHFATVGEPSQVALPVDRETGRPRGFAFVEFAERTVAEAVIERFNGQSLKGRPLAISEARAREDRPPMSGPRPPRPAYSGGGGGFGGGGFSGGPPSSPRPPRGPDFPSDAGRGPAGPSRERRPPKGKAKPERPAPKGPIRERNSGRLLAIDDAADETESTEIDFDDPATSKPHEDEDEG